MDPDPAGAAPELLDLAGLGDLASDAGARLPVLLRLRAHGKLQQAQELGRVVAEGTLALEGGRRWPL